VKLEADDAALDQDEDNNGKQSSEDSGVVSMKEIHYAGKAKL
jgi:hypothetical protein